MSRDILSRYHEAGHLWAARRAGWTASAHLDEDGGETDWTYPPEGGAPWERAEVLAAGPVAMTLAERGLDADPHGVARALARPENSTDAAAFAEAMSDYNSGRELDFEARLFYADEICRRLAADLRSAWPEIKRLAAEIPERAPGEAGVMFEEIRDVEAEREPEPETPLAAEERRRALRRAVTRTTVIGEGLKRRALKLAAEPEPEPAEPDLADYFMP